jgi:GDP-L-fucose synthase
LGSAILARLQAEKYTNIVARTHQELDLLQQTEVENFFRTEKPQYVIMAAAKVGGIKANISFPAQFIYENITIQTNVIHASYKFGVKKLLFLGSACSYPRQCPQPIKEEYLLSGHLEPTNESYAVAKIAGISMCRAYNRQYRTNFICGIPTNIYGPGDNFDIDNSHVIPALLRKFHEAKEKQLPSVTVWGSGTPKREFIYLDDVSRACIFLMNNYDSSEVINIGTGREITIRDLSSIIKKTADYQGAVVFDKSKSDGIMRKVLDPAKINALGWKAVVSLEQGISQTYHWYCEQKKSYIS